MSEHRSSALRAQVIPLPARQKEDNALTWQWMMAQLIDESHSIHAVLKELDEMGNPDWSAALSMWQLQFTGIQLVAAASPDTAQRAKFETVLAERKAAMDALLARIRRVRTRRAS